MPFFYLLEQTRTLIPGETEDDSIVIIKFFPLKSQGKPFLTEAPDELTAWQFAKKFSIGGRLMAIQEKTSYDATVTTLIANRANGVLRSPAPSRPRTPNPHVQRGRNLS